MSFLAWLTSTSGSLLILAGLIVVATAALIWDHHAEPADRPADDLPRRGPRPAHRPPPQPLLTPAEQAFLASLAIRYAHHDPGAGRMLADYLRQRCPGVSDVDLMRCVIALGHAARYFHRHSDGETGAFARMLHAYSGAVLDLSAIERDEIPR